MLLYVIRIKSPTSSLYSEFRDRYCIDNTCVVKKDYFFQKTFNFELSGPRDGGEILDVAFSGEKIRV